MGPRRPCLDCPALAEPGRGRCAACQSVLNARKNANGASRDPEYRRVRAELAKLLPLPCSLCPEPITHTGLDAAALSVDHIREWINGGSNDPSNLRPAHIGCNARRRHEDRRRAREGVG